VFGIWRAFAYDAAPVNDPKALGFFVVAAGTDRRLAAGAGRCRRVLGAVAGQSRGTAKVAYLRSVGFRDRAKTVPLQALMPSSGSPR